MMSIEKDRRVELAGLGLTAPEIATIEERFPDFRVVVCRPVVGEAIGEFCERMVAMQGNSGLAVVGKPFPYGKIVLVAENGSTKESVRFDYDTQLKAPSEGHRDGNSQCPPQNR